MTAGHAIEIRRLGDGDVTTLRSLMHTFGRSFDDEETYTGSPPTEAYLRRLLADETFIALAALDAAYQSSTRSARRVIQRLGRPSCSSRLDRHRAGVPGLERPAAVAVTLPATHATASATRSSGATPALRR
jgi:hypothetical protein